MKLTCLLFLLWWPLCGDGAEPVPAVAIFESSAGLVSADAPRGITHVVIWPDGRIIWSHKQADGTFVFLSGHVQPARVQALLDRFEHEGVFDEKAFRHSYYGPDSFFTTIRLQSGTQHTRLESWHEDYWQHAKAAASSGEATPSKEGQPREQVIPHDETEDQRFLRIWDEVRAAVDALIPAQGDLYTQPLYVQYPN